MRRKHRRRNVQENYIYRYRGNPKRYGFLRWSNTTAVIVVVLVVFLLGGFLVG